MKILYALSEKVEQIDYIKECTKNLGGTLGVCGGVYGFSRDGLTAEQSINGTITMLQDYCEFLYENISKLKDDMQVLLDDMKEVIDEDKAGEIA